jgi:hypothetical protein
MTWLIDGKSAIRILIWGALAVQLWIFVAILAALGVIGWGVVTAVTFLLSLV